MKGRLSCAFALAALCVAFGVEAVAATNLDVVALVRAKVGDEVIIEMVANEPCGYETGIDQIIALRKADVSSKVIAAMIRKCGSMRSSKEDQSDPSEIFKLSNGFYAVGTDGAVPRHTQILPAIVAAGRSGGLGTLFFPAKSVITLPAERALTVVSQRPTFWIVMKPIEGKERQVDLRSGILPSEFHNIKLVSLDKKAGKRQLQTGSYANGRALSGFEFNNTMQFRVSRVSESVSELTISAELMPGEYAFIANDNVESYRIYDFAVR